jgi:hypothetical protein
MVQRVKHAINKGQNARECARQKKANSDGGVVSCGKQREEKELRKISFCARSR